MGARLGFAARLARAVGKEAARLMTRMHKDLAREQIHYKRAREDYLAAIKPAKYDPSADNVVGGLDQSKTGPANHYAGERVRIIEHGQSPWYLAARSSITGKGPRQIGLEQPGGGFTNRWISRKSEGWRHPGVKAKDLLGQLRRAGPEIVKQAMINIMRGSANAVSMRMARTAEVDRRRAAAQAAKARRG